MGLLWTDSNITEFANVPRCESFLREETRCWIAEATPGQQVSGNVPLALLAQLLPWTTDLYSLWMRPRNYSGKFLKHLRRQFHIAYSCHLPLFLLTEGIKKINPNSCSDSSIFYVTKGKKSLNSCVSKTQARWPP